MLEAASKTIYVDPSSTFYYGGRFFDRTDSVANRDDVLLPVIRLREELMPLGVTLETADALLTEVPGQEPVDYYSLGIDSNFRTFYQRPGVRLKAFVIYEPPVVAPHLYRLLPELCRLFERVYVHNTHGDGYTLDGVDRSKLRKLYFPQPYAHVLDSQWEREERLKKLVVINANKRPKTRDRELYSKRIEAVAELSKLNAVDLYGPGWDRPWLKVGRFRYVIYPPALRHHKALKAVNHGPCKSKYETLSQYRFCLCFENMVMDGYVTEKLIDCLYAGTVPVYLGAPDIADYVPPECFIDFKQFASYQALWAHLSQVDQQTIDQYREAGRRFLESEAFRPFYDALPRMLEESP